MTDLEKYVIARWTYSIGTPIISDAEYSLLHTLMQTEYPDNEYVNRSWSSDPCPVTLLKKYGMEQYIKAVILSDKTESIPSLNSYREIREEFSDIEEEVEVSYKHDGWNIQASYFNGSLIHVQTRGRSSDAIITDHIWDMFPQHIPPKGKITVVSELTANREAFEYAKKRFGNVSQRGCVSTFLANKDVTHMLSVHSFKIIGDTPYLADKSLLKQWGFNVPMYQKVSSYEELLEAIKVFSDYLPNYDFPTDGLVVAGDKTRAIRVAAWEEPILRSYVTGYKQEFGPYACSIGLVIYPIKRDNSTQVNIPATNIKRLIEMDLKPGHPVAFKIVSSAIAAIDEEATHLLHKTYKGRFEEFQQQIQQEEKLKQELNQP